MKSSINHAEELNQENLENNSEKIKLSYDTHSFDPVLASQIGVLGAVMVKHFQYWIRYNKKAKKNFRDGRTWSYQKIEDIALHFDYLSEDQVRDVLYKLENGRGRKSKKQLFKPILKRGNYNKVKFDRTIWYAFEDEQHFIKEKSSQNDLGKCPNGSGDMPTTIPHTKTNTKEISSKEDIKKVASIDAQLLSNYLFKKLKKLRPKRIEPNWKSWEIDMKRAIEIDKRSPKEILKMIDWVFDTDNKFVVDCPSSLRSKYEKIADHMVMEKNKAVAEEKDKKDPRVAKAIEIIKKYLSKVNNGSLPNQLSFKLQEDGGVYHTVEKRKYSRVYEKFIEALKNHNAPEHLIKMIYEGIKEIK